MKDAGDRADEALERRVPCEVYSRIVGYLRPVQDWNKGKQQEFAERRTYFAPLGAQKSRTEVSSIEREAEAKEQVHTERP